MGMSLNMNLAEINDLAQALGKVSKLSDEVSLLRNQVTALRQEVDAHVRMTRDSFEGMCSRLTQAAAELRSATYRFDRTYAEVTKDRLLASEHAKTAADQATRAAADLAAMRELITGKSKPAKRKPAAKRKR